MTSAWIVYGLLVGSLLAATALALEEVCRLARWPVRWVWAGTLALTTALAGLAPERATSAVPAASVGQEVTARNAAGRTEDRHGWLSRLSFAAENARRAVAMPLQDALASLGGQVPAALAHQFAVLWLSLSILLFSLCTAVYARVLHLRRSWPVAQILGIRVRVAPAAGPAVIGLSRPEIVVPRWLLHRTPEEQRLVLAHEREHVRARDPLLLAAGCFVAVLLPWHPAVWWMLARLRLAVELDCDARLLGQGVAPRSYGTLLIDLAGQCSGMRVGAPALAAKSSHLERRLLAMQPHHPRFAPARGSALSALAIFSLLAACEARLPTAAQVDRMDVSAAEGGLRRLSLGSEGDSFSEYTLDGARVSAAQARALAPEQIATIAVERRGDASGAKTVVRITSREAAEKQGLNGAPPLGPLTAVKDREKFTGIIVIDGVRSVEAAMKALPRAEIRSVEVIKGPAATKLYSAPEAANGVIRITTGPGKMVPRP